jgi:hypothetical protein
MEPLFQKDLLIRIFERTNGDSWLEEHQGIRGSTSRRRRTKHMMDPRWRPWYDARKGTSLEFTEQAAKLIREHRFRNPQVVNKEMTVAGILTILEELWRGERRGNNSRRCACPQCRGCSVDGVGHGGGLTRRAGQMWIHERLSSLRGESCTLWDKV